MKTMNNYNEERILKQIHLVRGQKVMFDFDLAILYGIETKQLKQAVRRNLKRFPPDFMFEMNQTEFENQRSQIVTFNSLKYRPFCFTEQGVTMLSCILNSPVAIEVNIRVIRIFAKMREMISSQKEILEKLEQLEGRLDDHDESLQNIFNTIRILLERNPPRNGIGYMKSL